MLVKRLIISLFVIFGGVLAVDAGTFPNYVLDIDKDSLFNEVTVQFAWDEMYLRETTGRNDGTHIMAYMNTVKLDYRKRYPYCAAGLSYCMSRAAKSIGIKYPFKYPSAGAVWHFNQARVDGTYTTTRPQKGSLMVWKMPKNSKGHIAIVDSVINTYTLRTLEFNTSNGKQGSQREGNGNYPRIRKIHPVLGRLRLRGFITFR